MSLRWDRGLVLCVLVTAIGGCAAGDNPGDRDGATMDGDTSMDSGGADGGMDRDAGPDAGMVDPDGGGDFAGTCEGCEAHADCGPGAFCVSLTVGGHACVPGCNPDIPSCPRQFNCVLDIASGVDSTVCLPTGGPCCVDEDIDMYGQGVGCDGPDCNDDNEAINPAASEICDGIDDDCDGTADDPPTDCLSGRCTQRLDGTYVEISGADCVLAACASGTTTPCGLFTCEDGGEAGNSCASSCQIGGVDEDDYCIDGAHCTAGACVADVPNGGACNEDTDCTSAHCDNGFCCGTGTCCSTAADCPSTGQVCENSMTCQGTRGTTTCSGTFQCTTSGVDDDSGCAAGSGGLTNCGRYDPVTCTGASNQTPPVCPDSCTGDAECIDSAHCDFGDCVRDRMQGASCTRAQDCTDGLFCVDGVCCNSACTGSCQACNVIGFAGMCTNVPAMADPNGECPGFSCSNYYDGFGPGEDACYSRQPVSDSLASCNGAGACINAATMCPLQPRGPVQVDCNNTCEAPISGTCTGMTAGSCMDLDNPAITTMCGQGVCARTVQRCMGGLPQTCNPGTPVAETCNNLDDDCNGTPDNGSGASLCPSAPLVDSYTCSGGTCSFSCISGYYNLNGTYGDGCECADDAHGNACSGPTALMALTTPGTSASYNGTIAPNGEIDWFTTSFPSTGRGPAQGTPRIALTGPNASNFVLSFYSSCGTSVTCQSGSASNISSWEFRDNQSSGLRAYVGPHTVSWPGTLVFSVSRLTPTTSCTAAQYTVTVSR